MTIQPAYILKDILPLNVISVIHKFIPRQDKPNVINISPKAQKDLLKIQNMKLKGKSANYLKDLEDFCLD